MQRSTVTEYIAEDLTRTFAAEEIVSRIFVNKIIKYIKKNVRRQQCFEFKVPPYVMGYKPYNVARTSRLVSRVLRNLGLHAEKKGDNIVYVEIEINLDKLLRKYEQSLASSISSELAYDYEKIGLITREQKERIYERNRAVTGLSLSAPYSGYAKTVPTAPRELHRGGELEDSFKGMTLDELFEGSDTDTASHKGSETSKKSSKRLDDYYDI